MSKLINFSLLLTVFILCSCKSTKIVEVPVETIKTQYIDKIKYDSIYSKDSVYIMQKGDTIYNNKIQYLYKYRYIRDTISIVDTIPKIVTIERSKYINKLTSVQKILIAVGMSAIIYFILWIFFSIKFKLKK